MKGPTWLFAAVFLAGIAFVAWLGFGRSMMRVNEAKDHVRAKMRDPVSVQFRAMAAHSLKPPLQYVVCGEFNAKNGFGAYTGFQRFYVFRDGDVRMEGKYEKFETGWFEFCMRTTI